MADKLPSTSGQTAPRVAVVTGAAGTIGSALVRELLHRGYHVEAFVRNIPSNTNLHQTLLGPTPSTPQNVRYTPIDLCSTEQILCIATDLIDIHQRIHILINNAAVCPQLGWIPEHFHHAFVLNVQAPALLTEALLPRLASMRERISEWSNAMPMHHTAPTLSSLTSQQTDTQATSEHQPSHHAVVLNVSSGDAELLYFGKSLQNALNNIAESTKETNSRQPDNRHRTSGATACIDQLRVLTHQIVEQTPPSSRSGVIHSDDEHPAYRLSKACLNVFTRRTAVELNALGVRVVAVCPGDVPSRMSSLPEHATAGAHATGQHAAVSKAASEGALPLFLMSTRQLNEHGMWTTPQCAARDLIDLAENPNVQSGKFYRFGRVIPW